MSVSAKHLIRQPFAITIVVSLVLNGLAWFVATKLFPVESSAAILHYNTSVGIDFIGAGNQITAIPMIGAALMIGNLLLAALLRRVSQQAATMFWACLPLNQAILLVSLLLILRLNK